MPDVYFPVDTALRVINYDLYVQAYEHNGYSMPQIESFPSWFSDFEWDDSALSYPYMVFELGLDTAGQVVSAEKVFATDPSFADQVMSAALWASFRPARLSGKAVASRSFLIVSQYPHTPYPTREWRLADSSTQTYLEKQQLRLVGDTVGMLSVPVMRLYPGDKIKFGGRFASARDSAVAAVRVDATGKVSAMRLDVSRKVLRAELIKMLAGLRYFPAVDYRGKPQAMSGLLKLTLTGSGNIRIDHFWLSL